MPRVTSPWRAWETTMTSATGRAMGARVVSPCRVVFAGTEDAGARSGNPSFIRQQSRLMVPELDGGSFSQQGIPAMAPAIAPSAAREPQSAVAGVENARTSSAAMKR